MNRSPIKIFIASNRSVGRKCQKYAEDNLPDGYQITSDIEESDIVFSIIYDKIFSEDFLLGRKCFNFHYGILPDYGGVGSATWVILNDEQQHGVTLHEITAGLDQGPIIHIDKFSLEDNDTALSLYEKCEVILFQMFQSYFLRLLSGEYESYEQTQKPTMYRRRKLEMSKDITKIVRAFYFPGKEDVYYYSKSGKKIYVKYDVEEI